MQHETDDNHIEQSGESDNRLLFYPTGSRNRTSTRTKFVTEFATKSSEEVGFCRLNRPQTSMSLSVESRPKSASIRIVRSRSRSLVSYLVVSRISYHSPVMCGACRLPYIYPRPPGSGVGSATSYVSVGQQPGSGVPGPGRLINIHAVGEPASRINALKYF